MPIITNGIGSAGARLPGVIAEDGIVEFVEELCLRFGLFNDNTQVCLQGDNLAVELTISTNMSKEHFRIGCFSK